jgi:hypothetical protein
VFVAPARPVKTYSETIAAKQESFIRFLRAETGKMAEEN